MFFTLSASCLGKQEDFSLPSLWEGSLPSSSTHTSHPAPHSNVEHGTGSPHAEHHQGIPRFFFEGEFHKSSWAPAVCSSSPDQAAVGSGISQTHLGMTNQPLSFACSVAAAPNCPSTATRASLGFGNRKNKHKGSFHFRNGKETGKHGWEIVALSQQERLT